MGRGDKETRGHALRGTFSASPYLRVFPAKLRASEIFPTGRLEDLTRDSELKLLGPRSGSQERLPPSIQPRCLKLQIFSAKEGLVGLGISFPQGTPRSGQAQEMLGSMALRARNEMQGQGIASRLCKPVGPRGSDASKDHNGEPSRGVDLRLDASSLTQTADRSGSVRWLRLDKVVDTVRDTTGHSEGHSRSRYLSRTTNTKAPLRAI